MQRARPITLLAVALLGNAACDGGARTAVQRTQRECIDCHAEDRQRSSFPRHLDPGFPRTCEDCHTQREWSPASHDHRELPLVGAHSNATCADCHADEPVPHRCVGCHADDRERAKAPDHSADDFSDNCQDCHTSDAWKPATLDHSRFPFVGGHSAVACQACHPDPDRPERPRATTCVGCHDQDRQGKVADPNHLAEGFPSACESCHALTGWRDTSFVHEKFPLVGKHSTTACAACHAQDPLPTACGDCHAEDRTRAKEPNHSDEGFPTDCRGCHSATDWKPAAFDHTKFPLSGRHSGVACAECHTDPAHPEQPRAKTCVGCHDQDRDESGLPDHRQDGFPLDCEQCHTASAWRPAAFDHTKFALTGGHIGVACASCHESQPVPTTCLGCHDDDRAQAEDPNHLAVDFPTTCERCHSAAAWQPASTDHSRFPLIGRHAAARCNSCHDRDPVPTTCLGCHQQDRQQAKDPDHTVAGFSSQCDECHDAFGWQSASFAHDAFPLVGAHSAAVCASCHNLPPPIPTNCLGCHAGDRERPTDPLHTAAGFPTDCRRCHNANSWKPAAFDHSKFPLSGRHGGVDCAECHPDPTAPERPRATSCAGCHDGDRDRPRFPDHRASGFPTDCEQCHTAAGWKPAAFDHTAFPLNGGHSSVACDTCHAVEPVPTTCVGCHESDRDRPSDPNHRSAGFSTRCDDCHTTNAWIPAAFDHSSFPLTGRHTAVPCISCHPNPQRPAEAVGTSCFECHDGDRSTPQPPQPDHLASGFPTACQDCHSPDGWGGAVFDHDVFPLTGQHQTAPCLDCHFRSPVPQQCLACHVDERDRATSPNHLSADFPTACEDCHTTNGWKPAAFDHSAFPLTGGHADVDCTSCHVDPNTPSLPRATTCVGCHDAQRDVPAIPDHRAGGFPTDCASCHSTSAWLPASFDHGQYFPITSGPHRRPCNNCHLNPGDVGEFSCEGTCHKHTRSKMDDKHKEERGYSWDFPTCLNCHANGKKE